MATKKIKITPAKGRPMLYWVGKKPLDYIKSFPAQLIEVFNPEGKAGQIENPTYSELKDNWQNLLFHGDNKEVLGYLLANGFRGKIDLIYIDPPFDSKADYIRMVELRGGSDRKIQGEDYKLGEQIQYFDIWANDNYLQFMYERLLLLKELLSNKGLIFVHCDSNRNSYLRIILDEIFGAENFINEIIWQSSASGKTTKNMLPDEVNTLYLYSKSQDYSLNQIYMPLAESTKAMYKYEDNDGRGKYREFPLQKTGGPTPGTVYTYVDNKGNKYYPPKKGWRMIEEKLKALENDNRLIFRDGKVAEKAYWNERPSEGKNANNLWVDIANLQGNNPEMTDYPTQKPESLLDRIINLTSKPNDLILDAFCGCGTTQRVAQKLGRRWIGIDINKGAIQTSMKELQKLMIEQSKDDKKNGRQKTLNGDIEKPCLSLAHYQVNEYYLQLLRTEATELAIQHIGIERIKTDMFFDGTLGRNLVKIIDFNHPLTLLDLQLIRDELKKRPDENRNITIVCLGRELAIDPWIEDYNKKHPVNKLEVIELRTDKKYGKFLIYKPAEAKVDIKRGGGKAVIEIKDFISPSIIERLNGEEKLIKVKIPDFRSMIDVVLIDSDYNGKVFNIVHSDVPEKKNDLVQGKYEIEIPDKKTTVAVKIIDMLGEEVLITEDV